MAPFLDGGCQKYSTLASHMICGHKLIFPEKEMALSYCYWVCSDWTCENKHLKSINLFNLHSKVEMSSIKCSQVGSSP